MQHVQALLEWHRACGVDETLADAPVNHWMDTPVRPPLQAMTQVAPIVQTLPQPAMSSPLREATATPAPLPASPAAVTQAVTEARRLADACDDIPALYAAIDAFDGCAIKQTASRTVIAQGPLDAPVMVIGEAPGFEEDQQGVPFCGRSGQLLDKMLAAIGWSRDSECYITNSLFWRPPGNRKPNPEEVSLCRPFVQRHIYLLKPRLVLLMGGTAVASLYEEETRGITRLRGKPLPYVCPYEARTYPVLPLFHPSYLLRQPELKRLAWQDLLLAQEMLPSSHMEDSA